MDRPPLFHDRHIDTLPIDELYYEGMPVFETSLGTERIAGIERLIRPHVRRTPVIEVEGGDFGLDSVQLVFKLELFQHTGSFKTRGAFANLLTRKVPWAGVAAASGGNHGVAVAFAAYKLGKRAT